MKSWKFIFMIGLCAAGTAPAEEKAEERATRSRFATVFTFLDAVWDSKKVWTQADVEEEMRTAKSLGVDRIYWRIDGGGLFVYPTKVGTPYRWDGRGEDSANLKKSIDTIGDPLRAFAEAAKENGIEFYAWYPIRDRNSTSDRWNPKNPNEKESYERAGRHAVLSDFLKANPHFNMERRQQDGEHVPVPKVVSIRLKTSMPDPTLTEEDIQIWQSEDNLEYEPVSEGWTIKEKAGEGVRIFSIEGLSATKPWLKISSSGREGWVFSGGGVDEWITVVDDAGREWHPTPWMATADLNPQFGEARYPYSSAKRARHVRNDVPWDTITKFQFDTHRASIALFTPAMQPERYLLGFPCFAYPEVREQELKVIDELLTYPIDGIAICPRTHVRSVRGEDYGFNPPVVEEYQKRHGVNILEQPFDQEKLLEIHGDNFTSLLGDISQKVHAKGGKLVVMFEPEQERGLEWQPGQMAPWWDLGRMNWQWEKWTRDGIVDQIMIFTTGFNLPWDRNLQEYLAEVRGKANGKEVSLFYDPDYNPARQTRQAFLKLVRGALASPDVDEINVFEYVEFFRPEQPLNVAVKSLNLAGEKEQ